MIGKPCRHVLQNTFVHVPRIGYKSERKLWARGIRTWQDFIEQGHPWKEYSFWIQESIRNLRAGRYHWFKEFLPKREYWRVYPEFKYSTIFLDIETDPYRITVIGIYDGKHMHTFVRDKNLHHAKRMIERSAVIVTYNGTTFDLPILKEYFGRQIPAIHIDLMFLLRRIGLRGGLKSIEKQVGIRRPPAVWGLAGWDAVKLWASWKNGNPRSLSTLIKYNTQDAKNLKPLLELGYSKLKAELF